MVVGWKPQAPFHDGLVRIDRRAGETQEQFDATKDQAVYEVDGKSQTLQLDGRIDPALQEHFQASLPGAHFLTDIRDLAPRLAELQAAAKKSEEFLATAEVDLGTGEPFWALPETDSKTHQIYEYQFINAGPQEITLTPGKDGVTDLCVSTRDADRQVGHSMRARFHPDGTIEPWLEGATWHVAPGATAG